MLKIKKNDYNILLNYDSILFLLDDCFNSKNIDT